jgi:hypothetical protein
MLAAPLVRAKSELDRILSSNLGMWPGKSGQGGVRRCLKSLPSIRAFLFICPKSLHESFIYKRVHDELRHQLVGNVALAVIQRECINMRCNLA